MVVIILLVWAILLGGCSGSGSSDNPILPGDITANTETRGPANHSPTHLWDLYTVYIDVPAGIVDVIPNRQAMFTCNVVNFLNSKTGTLDWVINDTTIGPGYADIDIDISITHPFPGMHRYHGYDVRGVFMGDGSSTLNYNPDLIYPVNYVDQHVLADPDDGYGGPDGYTRWFNKPEFSTGGMPLFQYTQGAQAPPEFDGNATLNPYKYFADGLEATGDLWTYLNEDTDGYGQFSSGATNTRNYYLRFPNLIGTVFGYAVVATWKGPDPVDHPANAPEAVACTVTDTSDLWFGDPTLFGGSIKLDISLWDWDSRLSDGLMENYKLYLDSTTLTSTHEFTPDEMIPTGGDENYSTYHVEIPADNTQELVGNEYWIIAEQTGFDYNNDLGVPNLADTDPLAAFFRYDIFVSDDIPSWIIIETPNGGEEWTAGFRYNITWVTQDVAGPLSIEYSKDNFVNDINVIVDSTENDGYFQWRVANDPSTTVKVRITDTMDPSVFDTSDFNFTILEKPTLTITVPNGGEIWDVGVDYNITWESSGAVSSVRIGYSKDNFMDDVHEIVASTPNDGVFEWQIPNDPSDTVKIGIVDTNYTSIYDVSDENFTIKAEKPTITVTKPNGGEEWRVNSNHDITWTNTDIIDFVKIEYSKDDFVSDIHEIVASTENDGVFEWHIPNDPSETARVRITDTSDITVNDTSDEDFTIEVKPIKVITPNGGEILYVDDFYNITWEADIDITDLRIGYSKDNFVDDIHEITASTPNDGVFEWQVPNDPSNKLKIAIVDVTDAAVFDLSDNNFTIKVEPDEQFFWNQFMHDPSHGGRSELVGPHVNNYIWTHEEGSSSSPAFVLEGFDGTLYYGNGNLFSGGDGTIWAVNMDGSTKWTFDSPEGGWAKPLGITPDNSVIYVGTNDLFGGSPFFGTISGLDTADGSMLWSVEAWDIMGWFFGSNLGLVVENGDFVTIADLPDQGFASSTMLRINQFGDVIWKKKISYNGWSAPAQGVDGHIYVNVQPFLGQPKIIAVDVETGSTVHQYSYESSPNSIFESQTDVAVRPDGKVVFASGNTGYCLNPDLTLAWSSTWPASVVLEGAIGIGFNNEIYAHSGTHLFALNADGAPLWLKPYTSNWMCPAIGADGMIYIGSRSGLAALDPSTGDPIWAYTDTPAAVPIIAHDGSLYVVIDTKLTKFGQ